MEKIPAYKKCYNKLKSDIDNNVYPIGSYLPTEDAVLETNILLMPVKRLQPVKLTLINAEDFPMIMQRLSYAKSRVLVLR